MKMKILLTIALFAFFAQAQALAATRTLCFEPVLYEEPEGLFAQSVRPCPSENPLLSAPLPAVRRYCRDFSDSATSPVGMTVQVWDKDPSGPDDLCGSFVISSSGQTCASFEWSGFCGGETETDPDLFVVFPHIVADKDGGSNLPYVNLYTTNASGTVSEMPQTSSRDTMVFSNCAGLCVLNAGQAFYVYYNPGDDLQIGLLQLDEAQRALEVFGSRMDSAEIKLVYPDSRQSDDGISGSCGLSYSRYEIGVNDENCARNNLIAAHEVGHSMQLQLFESDSFGPSERGDEKNRTLEAWAVYASAVSWYLPNDSAASPIIGTCGIENAQPVVQTSCSANASNQCQIAKAFWDLDDANNEAAGTVNGSAVNCDGSGGADHDLVNLSHNDLADIWDGFVDGTSNRRDREPGPDGLNARDFAFVGGGTLTANGQSTFLNHNCICNQSND